MREARLWPLGDDLHRVEYTTSAVGTTFEMALKKADEERARGDFRAACNTRFEAFKSFVSMLPENEGVTLDWEDISSNSAMELIHDSALDHFLTDDWEMAAAMLEMLLELDPEDHLDATRTLVYCYIALQEWELLEEALSDMPERSPARALAALWGEWRRGGALSPELLAELREAHPELFSELTAADHPADEAFLADIDSERPSREARARELWLQTEHLWAAFPGFIEALEAQRAQR